MDEATRPAHEELGDRTCRVETPGPAGDGIDDRYGPSIGAVNALLVAHLLFGAFIVGIRWSSLTSWERPIAAAGILVIGSLVVWREVGRQSGTTPSGLVTSVVLVASWLAMVAVDGDMSFQQFTLFPALYCLVQIRLGLALAAIPMVVTVAAELADEEPAVLVLVVTIAGWLGGAGIAIWIQRESVRADRWHAMAVALEATRNDLAAAEREAGALDERRRFARDVHDTLAQSLTGIVLHCERLRHDVDASSPVAESVAQIEAVARAALEDARGLVAADRPLDGAVAELPTALQELAAQPLYADLDVRIHVDGAFADLDPPRVAVVYRAAREALSNVVKHASATTVDVSLSRIGATVALDVADDGCGFDLASRAVPAGGVTGGSGLASMRRQVAGIGGAVAVESGAGGTVLSVSFPIAGPVRSSVETEPSSAAGVER